MYSIKSLSKGLTHCLSSLLLCVNDLRQPLVHVSFIFADLAQLLLEQGVVRVLSLEVFWGRDFASDLRTMFHTLDRVL